MHFLADEARRPTLRCRGGGEIPCLPLSDRLLCTARERCILASAIEKAQNANSKQSWASRASWSCTSRTVRTGLTRRPPSPRGKRSP